jgi:pyridoxine/pyridoxamine 5'-phosphate oxidase
MNESHEHVELGKRIVDDALYMVIATADTSGQPWPSPVYFAHRDYRDFFWVSKPEASHSRNLRDRRELGIAIFDSSAPIGTGRGVYVLGIARELPGHEVDEGIEVFSARSREHGGSEWAAEDVREPAERRLYQATAEAVFVLDEHDQRVEVNLS